MTEITMSDIILECDFTKFDLICVEFLDSVSQQSKLFFSLRVSILAPKSLWKLKLNMFTVRMLLIWAKKMKSK